jgi:hypothetical protein
MTCPVPDATVASERITIRSEVGFTAIGLLALHLIAQSSSQNLLDYLRRRDRNMRSRCLLRHHSGWAEIDDNGTNLARSKPVGHGSVLTSKKVNKQWRPNDPASGTSSQLDSNLPRYRCLEQRYVAK